MQALPVPQVMPPLSEVTVPVPLPFLATVSTTGMGTKVAVRLRAPVMLTVHGVVMPVQLPAPVVQPMKEWPALGAAVSVTVVPLR